MNDKIHGEIEENNEEVAEKSYKKRWETCNFLPPLIALLALANFASVSLLIPFIICGAEYPILIASTATCLLSAATALYSSKKKLKAIIYVAVMGILFGAFYSPVLPAILLGTVSAIGSCAALICSGKTRSRLMIPLISVAAFGVALIISGDIFAATTALFPVLPAFALGLASSRKASLSTTVVCGAATLFIAPLATAAILIFINYGTVSPDTIHTAAGDLSASIAKYCEEILSTYGEMVISGAIANYIAYAVDYCINLMPGAIIALCTAIAYFAARTAHDILTENGVVRYTEGTDTQLGASILTSAVFAIAVVLSFSQDPHNGISIVATVALNICIILYPILALTAIDAIRWLPTKLGIIGLILAGALVVFVMISISSFPLILPMVGAAFVVIRSADDWAREHYSKGENK